MNEKQRTEDIDQGIQEARDKIKLLEEERSSLLELLHDRNNHYVIPSGRVYVSRGSFNPGVDIDVAKRLEEISIEMSDQYDIIEGLGSHF